MGTTFDEIMTILDKWEFILGQRAGRELWIDKPTNIQEEDLANFNRDLETVRSFINLLRVGGLNGEERNKTEESMRKYVENAEWASNIVID